MADRASDVGGEIVGCMADGRKRYNHEVHKQKDKFSVDEAAQDRTSNEHTKFSAGEVVDCGRAKRDGEMGEKTNGGGGPSHFTRMLSSKDAAGNCLQNSKGSRSHQTVSDERLSKIENAGQEPAREDRRKRTFREKFHAWERIADRAPVGRELCASCGIKSVGYQLSVIALNDQFSPFPD